MGLQLVRRTSFFAGETKNFSPLDFFSTMCTFQIFISDERRLHFSWKLSRKYWPQWNVPGHRENSVMIIISPKTRVFNGETFRFAKVLFIRFRPKWIDFVCGNIKKITFQHSTLSLAVIKLVFPTRKFISLTSMFFLFVGKQINWGDCQI